MRHPRRRSVLLAMVLAGAARPVIAVAQENASSPPVSPALTLSDAVQAALVASPAVRSAGALVDAARADVRDARSAWWPSLVASASVQQYEEPMIVTPIHGLTPDATPPFDETLLQGGATLAYTIFDGGARGARGTVAEGARAGAELSAEAVSQDVVMQTARRFLDVQSLRDLSGAHVQRLEALRRELDRVGRMREAGQVAAVDGFRVESAVARAEADLVDILARLEVAEADLGRLIDLPRQSLRQRALAPVEAPAAPLPERTHLLALGSRSNPALLGAERQAEAAAGKARLARSARWPRIEAGGQYASRGGGEGDFQGEWSAMLRLSIPLFTGGATSSRIARADAEHRAAQEHIRIAELDLAHAVDDALASVAAARARVESLTAAVRTASEVARVERLRVETGNTTETDYLDAEAALLEARATLVQARSGEAAAWLKVGRAAGTLTVSWLVEVFGP